MASLNKACLIGNVGKDPEIRSTQGGDRVANLSIATSESWTDRTSGQKKEQTEWHRLVVWGPLVDVIDKYVKKGSKLYVEGKIKTRKWSDRAGVEKYSTEIVLQGFDAKLVMLDSRRDGDGDGESRDQLNQSRHQRPAEDQRGYGGGERQREEFSHDLDDEIPF